MLGNLFSRGTPEERFWDFFSKNAPLIASIPSGNGDMARELLRQLTKYNKQLTYEITQGSKGVNEFVLSCNCVREEIPFANILYSAAPKIEGWNIVLFKRRKKIDLKLEQEGLELAPEDITMEYTLYKNEVHLRLYIRKYYQGDPRYKLLANKFLERTLGEFDKMTKVGAMEYVPLKDDMSGINTVSLVKLRDIVSENLR